MFLHCSWLLLFVLWCFGECLAGLVGSLLAGCFSRVVALWPLGYLCLYVFDFIFFFSGWNQVGACFLIFFGCYLLWSQSGGGGIASLSWSVGSFLVL